MGGKECREVEMVRTVEESPTHILIEQVAKREGVQVIDVAPYDVISVKVNQKAVETVISNGPAKILIVWD